MSDTPSRNIEHLLQAAAEKRRQEAGGPFELHPATRQLLQGEVTRRRRAAPGRAAVGDGFWQMLARLRFGFRFAASVVLVAGVTGLVVWSSTRTASREKSHPQIGVAASSDAIALQKKDFPAPAATPVAQPPPAAAPLAGKRELAALAPAAPSPVVASTPAPNRRPAAQPLLTVSADAVPVARTDSAKEITATRQSEVSTSTAGSPTQIASARQSQDFAVSGARDESTPIAHAAAQPEREPQTEAMPELTQNFRRAASAPTKAARTAAVTEPLANFQFVQSGSQLRVIDSDGSAYTGSIQVASAPAAPDVTAAPRAEASQLVGRSASKARQSPAMAPMGVLGNSHAGIGGRQAAATEATQLPSAPSAPAQTYNFRVVGANRTLKQNVLFTGQLHLPPKAAMNQSFTANSPSQQLPNATSQASQQALPYAANQSASNQASPAQNSLPLAQSRISGELRVGNRAPVPLEAQPLGQ